MEKVVEKDINIEYKDEDIISPWKIIFKRLKKNKLAMVSLVILCIFIIMSAFAPLFTPYERDGIDFEAYEESPSTAHILGTDDLGRDIYTRLLYGGRVSLSVGIVAVVIEVALGVLLGGIAGFYGGIVDSIIMRITDVFMSFPFLIIAITVVSILGPSMYNVMLVIGFLGWTGIARIVRGQILSLREQEFMEATEALGLSDFRKITRHLLPNTLASIIVWSTISIASAILTESSLSYLGLGVSPPIPTWGNMLQAAQKQYVIENQWWLWIPPGLAIFITVMSLNILGDGLRDAVDPKLKK